MSITSPDARISTYSPVVATTDFPAVFPVFDNDDLIVIHNGVERDDFAVSATYSEGISNNAKVVFALGITGDVKVVGRRDPRRTNRFNNGPLPVRDQNLALDTLEAESQEARRDIDRSLKSAIGSPVLTLPLPEPDALIGWGDSGELENKIPVAGSILLVPTFSTRAAAALFNLTPFDAVRVLRYSSGSHLIDTLYVKVGSEPSHSMKFPDIAGNWFEIGPDEDLSPYHNGCVGAGDETAKVQEVVNLAASRGKKLNGTGPSWPVIKITVSSGVYFEIIGNFSLLGIATDPQDCVFEVTRGNWANTGSISVDCQYKTNYKSAFWFHHATALRYLRMQSLNANRALIGIRVGDVNFGQSATSEITLSMPQSYGCPIGMQIEGGNTYISVVAPPMISGEPAGGNGAWAALARHALVVIGGSVTVIGGELVQTGSALATNWLVEIQPGMLGANIARGRVVLVGVTCETAGPLCQIHNPLGVTGLVANNDEPGFSVSHCQGYHSQDNAPFIYASADYTGRINWGKGNKFWFSDGTAGSVRTQQNIFCAGNLCHVYVSDDGFGNGFKGVLAGVTGGIQHFSRRLIAKWQSAALVTGTNLAAGANPMRFTSPINTGDLVKFNALFNSTTGEFTIPAGGFAELVIRAQIRDANATGRLIIRENGAEVAYAPFASQGGQVSLTLAEPTAGAKFTIAIVVDTGAGGTFVTSSGFLNRLDIEAAR